MEIREEKTNEIHVTTQSSLQCFYGRNLHFNVLSYADLILFELRGDTYTNQEYTSTLFEIRQHEA